MEHLLWEHQITIKEKEIEVIMEQYIDKAAVVAEIKRIYNEDYKFLPSDVVESVQDFKDDLLTALDGLSTVKEVDLERAIDKWIDDTAITHEDCSVTDVISTAKHFFELGLKAQKGKSFIDTLETKNV